MGNITLSSKELGHRRSILDEVALWILEMFAGAFLVSKLLSAATKGSWSFSDVFPHALYIFAILVVLFNIGLWFAGARTSREWLEEKFIPTIRDTFERKQ